MDYNVLWLSFLLAFSTLYHQSSCHTHWVVTEDGKIQAQPNSPFNMRRPHDLVALLQQEERVQVLNQLKKDLDKKKSYMEHTEERDTNFEAQFFLEDPDCRASGRPLSDHDLYISTVLPLENKGISPEEHIDLRDPPSSQITTPMCQNIIPLDYSIHAYEHLRAMQQRVNLTGAAELGLKNAITHRESEDDYGHLIREALKQNKTSWVLYNMAAFYWRIKGHPYNAVECLRRALHYSPRDNKDVALISLGNLFHRSRHSEDAAVVVEAAVEMSPDLNVNHFTLGNIYAVLTNYSKSIECFDNTLRIQRDFEAAASRRLAVLCHSKLEHALEQRHTELRQALNELEGYQARQVMLKAEKKKLATEQATLKLRELTEVAYQQTLMDRAEHGFHGEPCFRQPVAGSSKQQLVCSWERHPSDCTPSDAGKPFTLDSEHIEGEITPGDQGKITPGGLGQESWSQQPKEMQIPTATTTTPASITTAPASTTAITAAVTIPAAVTTPTMCYQGDVPTLMSPLSQLDI